MEISSFCICVPNTTIIRGTVPETRSETKIFAILGHFLPFYPSNIPENHNLKKWKKGSEDVIISYVYQKSQSYIECDRHNFLSFWAIFCTFSPLTIQKIKILKKWKNPWRRHHFTQVYQKSWLYAILFLRYNMWQM